MDISRYDEMIAHCKGQQEKQNNPAALVTFKVPQKAKGERVRLFKGNGPYGNVLQTSDTGTVAGFRADDVIEFLLRMRDLELSRQISAAKKAIGENK